jgi:DNA helicase-2/ATP-dependent DNA helicase PcrA
MYSTLSNTQRKIVFEKKGKFVVRACPGSGKTYTVAARLAHLISDWKLTHQGIAAISFTNTAWQEIQRQINDHFQMEVSYPHFLGTIDSFINRFIFLPFGYLVMKCNSRPVLVGEPHGPWSGRYFSEKAFDKISYDINGNLNLYVNNDWALLRAWNNRESNKKIVKAKERLIKTGYATQTDANYFSMKVLEKYPEIAKAIVHRFPVLIVDESQDTSEIQMRIIDLLIDNGLSEVMLVGDPDQAIFEWHTAKPQLFNEKMEGWEENSIVLNENRRSSQKICDFTYKLSSLNEPSIAVNDEVKDYEFVPKIVVYDLEHIQDLVKDFKQLCHKHNIPCTPKNIAVLYRSKGFFCHLAGFKEISDNEHPWCDDDPYCQEFAKGKYLFDNGAFKEGFNLILRSFVKKNKGLHYCSAKAIEDAVKDCGLIEFRKKILNIINLLPQTNCTIGDWVKAANDKFRSEGIELEFTIERNKGNIGFDDLFCSSNKRLANEDLKLGTIHSAKGETFEAVMVILKKRGIGRHYKTLLKNNVSIQDNEELRIVYVGITRPRKLLVLAVPDEEDKLAWERKLIN